MGIISTLEWVENASKSFQICSNHAIPRVFHEHINMLVGQLRVFWQFGTRKSNEMLSTHLCHLPFRLLGNLCFEQLPVHLKAEVRICSPSNGVPSSDLPVFLEVLLQALTTTVINIGQDDERDLHP